MALFYTARILYIRMWYAVRILRTHHFFIRRNGMRVPFLVRKYIYRNVMYVPFLRTKKWYICTVFHTKYVPLHQSTYVRTYVRTISSYVETVLPTYVYN